MVPSTYTQTDGDLSFPVHDKGHTEAVGRAGCRSDIRLVFTRGVHLVTSVIPETSSVVCETERKD